MLTYTLNDYSRIKLSTPNNQLPEDVLATYNNLLTQLNIVISSPSVAEHKEKRINKKQRLAKQTEAYPPIIFKEKVVNEVVGPDKILLNIRGCFNKLTIKNYDTHRDLLITHLNELRQLNEESYLIEISNQFFDVASKNSFYSEMYALLYKELTQICPLFEERKEQFLIDCVDSLETIIHVDEKSDYEGFCKNNKSNDVRRSMNTFLINLYKKGEFNIQDVFKIIKLIEDKLNQKINDASQRHVVEELTENLYLFVSELSSELKTHQKWQSVYESIERYSKCNISDYQGLNNRIKFKYMDMIDVIKKNK
jgi:hypothetical protein